MLAAFLFALTLFIAVLLSDLAERSILSTAVIFLLAGFLAGDAGLGVVHLQPGAAGVSEIAALALFSTLFTDGMRAGIRDLAESWRLPGRALLLGFPLTLLGNAVLAHWLGGLNWSAALLLGAVLTPTDPVFAAALVRREDLSGNLRRLLNVESGLNDGLALPMVLWLMQSAGPSHDALQLAGPLLVGVAIGVGVPWIADRLEKSRWFRAHESYRPMAAFALALLVLSLARLVHGNEFLAAFAAGVTVISIRPEISLEFREFAENLANLFKFAALFIFGALLSPALWFDLRLPDYLFAVLALLVVRPVAILLALLRSPMNWRERLAAAWFGPKGFASVLFAVLVLQAGVPDALHLFNMAALVITASIVAHSSTDVVVARWLTRHQGRSEQQPPRRM